MPACAEDAYGSDVRSLAMRGTLPCAVAGLGADANAGLAEDACGSDVRSLAMCGVLPCAVARLEAGANAGLAEGEWRREVTELFGMAGNHVREETTHGREGQCG